MVKKGWKKAFGWADDDITKSVFTAAAISVLTGGIGGLAVGASFGGGAVLGAIAGGVQGVSTGLQMQQQEKMLKAQIASQEKIAAMQNAPVVQSAVTPTATTQNAAIEEQNAATSKRKALSFANTTRGSIGRRLTLG